MDFLLTGVHAATFAGGTARYGEVRDAAIAIKGEFIEWVGPAAEGMRRARAAGARVLEMKGGWVTPGLIDCHTHLVFGGNRAREFEERANGVTYEEIARRGGGIRSTMQATREASDADLLDSALIRARRLCAEGVTTLEIKSGYGESLAEECRLLRLARQVGDQLPVSVCTTFLGLHALPVEFHGDRSAFVETICGAWLDTVAAEKLADAVDAFCETIAFTVSETERFLARAQALGLGIHLHAGQLADIGAAQLAARFRALSADHLEYADEAAIAALASAGTVAVLLPCAYYTLRQTQPPPVELMRRHAVPMAVATDCNPGTSPCSSLLLALNMACTLFGLTPAEALAGATREAAKALGVAAERGTIEPGKRADLAFWRIDHPAELVYALGANPCVGVMHRGTWRES